jgi:hypothetical protein
MRSFNRPAIEAANVIIDGLLAIRARPVFFVRVAAR